MSDSYLPFSFIHFFLNFCCTWRSWYQSRRLKLTFHSMCYHFRYHLTTCFARLNLALIQWRVVDIKCVREVDQRCLFLGAKVQNWLVNHFHQTIQLFYVGNLPRNLSHSGVNMIVLSIRLQMGPVLHLKYNLRFRCSFFNLLYNQRAVLVQSCNLLREAHHVGKDFTDVVASNWNDNMRYWDIIVSFFQLHEWLEKSICFSYIGKRITCLITRLPTYHRHSSI